MNTYTVRPGDTISALSQRYNVPQSSITGYSSGNPNLIKVGEQLHMPSNSANTSTPLGPAYTPAPPPSGGLNYSPSSKLSTPSFNMNQPSFIDSAVKGIGATMQNVKNTVVPQSYAADLQQPQQTQQTQQQNPPPRKTFNVAAPTDAISTPGFVNGTPDWVKPMIQKAAEKNNIPTALLSALIKQESNFNPNARSGVGAQGIAQFMPGTAQGMGVDPMDPESAINGAAQYLRKSWDRFGKPELALAAYNAGGGAVNQYGGIPPYKETQNYVKNIMNMIGEIHQSAAGPLHDTINEIKKQSANQSKIGKSKEGSVNSYPSLMTSLPAGFVSPISSPVDQAIARIRRAKPTLSLSDQQIRHLYNTYGSRILDEIPE